VGSISEDSDLRHAVWDAAGTALLVASADGTICQVNAELERLFGYPSGQLIGRQVEDLMPTRVREAHIGHRHRYFAAPTARPMGIGRDLIGLRADGSEVPLEVGLQPLSAEAGPLVLVSVRDISDRVRTAAEHAAALERQYAFEQFLAGLSFQLIDVSDQQLPDAVGAGLEEMCQRSGLDRAVCYALDDHGRPELSMAWARDGLSERRPVFADPGGYSWITERLRQGQTVFFEWVDEIPDSEDRRSLGASDAKSALLIPLLVNRHLSGVVEFDVVGASRAWSPSDRQSLTTFAAVMEQVLARRRRDAALGAAREEASRLKDQLEAENRTLLVEALALSGELRVVGRSAAVSRVLAQIEQVAPTNSTVLLLGETGTGKELFASYIHELSQRRRRQMVRVNCAAIPPTLIESELFGRERGAYTGSLARQIGRFELAHQSTIFLDEIGDLPAEIQVKLLRVLEERTIERLGSSHPIEVDVRIIAATHRDLDAQVAAQVFRDDLYYRLNVFPIYVPPLRERAEDIPLLLWRFVEEFSRQFGKRIDEIDKASIAALQQYSWPGNIRELRNVVERAMIVGTGRRLVIPTPVASPAALKRSPRLEDVEKEHIRSVLEGCGWRIRGADGAASKLGLKPTTLETRMAKLGLRRPGRA
jgi:PAS domain S-box-containing protein